MPNIPTITANVSARTQQGALVTTQATGEDFGAGVGRAMQALGKGVEDLGVGIEAYRKSNRNNDVAAKVAMFDDTPRELEIRNNTPANGEGYYKNVTDGYVSSVDNYVNDIPDPLVRKEVRERLMAQRPGIAARSAQYESTLAATDSKYQADTAIQSLNNKIMSDPSTFDTYVTQGLDVIDAQQNITPSLKEGMKLKWKQDSANARFNGMLERAKTVDDIDAIAQELTGVGAQAAGPDDRPKDWAKEFAPQDYERMINTIGTTRKAIVTKADADARAAIETLEERAKDVNTLLPQEELATVQGVVKQSQNPITVARMARIVRDQQIIRETRNLPPGEIQSRINAANGNPSVAYPGVPPRVSNAINKAVSTFDVSASYLGATVQREYGSNLRVSRQGNPQFTPRPQHNGVDLRNVRPDVVDAATVAGELFGEPLNITSGYRSQEKQNNIRFSRGNPNRPSVAKESKHTDAEALDITTVGMSAERKAQLAGALVDAGFTGIGEYDTHIHADMRSAVPSSFGKDGSSWGGWTNLSPEVMAALKQRGYAAGLSSEQIARKYAKPVKGDDASIDYAKPTSLKGPDGKPASSALGIMQFVDSTFLEVMKTPGMAARMGLNIEGKSDAELLELRKDPDISIMAGAAFAEKNKKILQNVLGRTATDPELYMAHFLGAGGATSLISGLKNQPQQSAAALLPDAAAANKPIFYDGGKALTVQQVYDRLVTRYSTEPTRVAYGDNDTRRRVMENAQKAISTDPMQHASSTGTFNVSSLQDQSGAYNFGQRGQEARSVADYYNIPVESMKPFTESEAENLTKYMKDGSSDDALQVITAIQNMGGDMATAALKQIGEKDAVMGYAGSLQLATGQGSVASDIVRGQKRLEENKSLGDAIGAQPRDISDAFVNATGGALYAIDPRQRQAIQDAAYAHYVETVASRSSNAAFDAKAFGNSVQAVMGGTKDGKAVDYVNGELTVLPRGVSGDEMEEALNRMNVDDWARMSNTGLPPRYVNGEIISPQDLASEGTLKAIGGDKYRIQLDDGTFAITGEKAQNGRLEAYVFTPDAKKIKDIATRPAPAEPENTPTRDSLLDTNTNDTTIEEQQRLRETYGALHQFDENGRWIGPAK